MKSEDLKANFIWKMYFTGSLNLAYMFPHIGHILEKSVIIDDEVIPKGYMIFYDNYNGLFIMSPTEWENDRRSCYEVDIEDFYDKYIYTGLVQLEQLPLDVLSHNHNYRRERKLERIIRKDEK